MENCSSGCPCLLLFYAKRDDNCVKYHSSLESQQNNTTTLLNKDSKMFACHNKNEIDASFVNDAIPDCAPNAEDEILLFDHSNSHQKYCKDRNQLPCHPSYVKCFNIFDTCSYKLDAQGHVLLCANGAHLENCTHFECNVMFKCPSYYCILWQYVCNDMWDCPQGKDEVHAYCQGYCHHMYMCRGKDRVCIHQGQVCDGQKDCIFEEDEKLCALKYTWCPFDCICVLFAIFCNNVSVTFPQSTYPYIFIQLESLTVGNVLRKFSAAAVLNIIKTNLNTVCGLAMDALYILNAEFNNVIIIRSYCFSNTQNLSHVALNDNKIRAIKSKGFALLLHLRLVNLSNNPLLIIPDDCFPRSVQVLSLYGNPLTGIDQHIFKKVDIDLLETKDTRLCCVIKEKSKCSMQLPWYLSCQNLLPHGTTETMFWTVSVIILVLNTSSILIYLKLNRENLQNTLLIVTLNCIEMFCCLYLGVIVVANSVLKETFVVKQDLWKSSSTCFAASGFVSGVSMLSPAGILLLSLSRLMIVLHPLTTHLKNVSLIVKCILAIFLCGLSLLVSLHIAIQETAGIFPLSICLPFVDPSNSYTVFKVTPFVVASIQIPASVAVGIIHYLLVKELKESDKTMKSVRKERLSLSLIVQLACVTLSHAMCWLPTNIVCLIALSLSQYPVEMILWTATAVAPINSVLSPIVFSISLLKKVLQEKKN